MVARTTYGPVAHEWTANEDDAGHHHGLLDFSAAPMYLALYWQSKRRGRMRFALLEQRTMKTADEVIIEREVFWKRVLMSRGQFGYKKN